MKEEEKKKVHNRKKTEEKEETGKEYSGKERRQKILTLIQKSDGPISGTELGKKTGVSRQVVVQDIALLRTEGYSVIATAKGYYLEKALSAARILKVYHSEQQVKEELTTIVDLGGIVYNVMVNHRVYGKVIAQLNIKNRRDIQKFMENIETGKSTPLMNVTSGYHFHKIGAENEEILDEIEQELKKKGFLAEILPYEEIQ